MIGNTVVITEPAYEPVTLDEVMRHLRIDTYDDIDTLSSLINISRNYIENITNRSLVEKTYDWFFDQFPPDYISSLDYGYNRPLGYGQSCAMIVPHPPLLSVGYIKYLDGDGDWQTWDSSNYIVDANYTEGRIYPVYGGVYPSGVQDIYHAVNVRFTSGYAITNPSPDSPTGQHTITTPKELQHAMLLLIAHFYKQREATITRDSINSIPFGVHALLNNYRVRRF